jgi:methionyl-tRNA formyltransferase
VGIKLVFMGSATFALPSLQAVFESGFAIQGVVTQPDKPSGRGQLLQAPPVKKIAFDLLLPIYQPASLKTDEARQMFSALAPDLIVVVAYGKILPPWLLQCPRWGCINVHGSLLPKYRGAAPVHWAVANGEEKTGVCTMLLDEGLDTGPVYLCDETPIGADETTPQLYGRLADLGGPILVRTINGIVDGTLQAKPQNDSQATYAPILRKEHGYLDWRRPALEIHNHVRAFNPWPGTIAKFREKTCKILRTAVARVDGGGEWHPGSTIVSKGHLWVVCGDGAAVEILSIQPENRKAITGSEFANGAHLQAGEKFVPLKDN